MTKKNCLLVDPQRRTKKQTTPRAASPSTTVRAACSRVRGCCNNRCMQRSAKKIVCGVYVACNLRTCAVCRLHGAKYAVCRLHGTQSADCMVTVTKDPSKTCDSFSKFQRNLRFSARINFLTKLPYLKDNNLCLFDNGYYSFSCL